MDQQKYHLTFCSFVPVGLEDYVDYFITHFDCFTYLKWKFPHIKSAMSSSLLSFEKGQLISEKRLFSLPKINQTFLYFCVLPFNYIISFFQALFLLKRRSKNKISVFIGVNYFCTLCGIFLKKMGKTDIVIYRVMDFFPLPSNGIYRLLNRVFYIIDKYCLDNSDQIWFTTEGHIIGREKYGYFDRSNPKYKWTLIPLGINTKKVVSLPVNDTKSNSLVYCGVISRYHQLDLVFDVIAELKKEYPQIRLNLIGSGPDEEYYKKLAVERKLTQNIIFHGFLEENEHFSSLMANNILGIALYRDEENFMKYTEPAKVKFYLMYGIPAIISKVPQIAFELDQRNVSFAVDNDTATIVNIVKKYLQDRTMQECFKKNIQTYVQSVNTTLLLKQVFQDNLDINLIKERS